MMTHLLYVILISLVIIMFSSYFQNQLWKMKTDLFNCEKLNELLGRYPNTKSIVNTNLFIGIISSSDHFRQRQSLRNTWLKLLPESIRYGFAVGEKTCRIHPMDRKSSFSCEDLNISIPENSTEETLIYANSVNLRDSCNAFGDNIGFSFHVHHSIIIKFLGIRQNILNKNISLKVVLTDLRTSEEIASVVFARELQKGSMDKDYIFKRLTMPVILPRGFEGVIKVEGFIENFEEHYFRDSAEWTHGNVLSVVNLITKNPNQTSMNYCALSTFGFTVKELDRLKFFNNEKKSRLIEWSQHIQETRKQIQNEAELYKDIIFLDLVDTYRNLPKKLLLFLKWVYTNVRPKYILKTDDDTFIDIKRVEIEINSTSGWDWWSCFRIGWPVQRHGKWRETKYQQKVYPPFPSGAGYVLSENVLAWLIKRSENLMTHYQGEDVALGIWLEEMNASRHVGSECYWACNKQYHSQTCNVVDLSVDDVYKIWEDFLSCGSRICNNCPGPT